MARGTSLGRVRAMLKAETSKSLLPSANQEDPYLNQIIADTQQWLASEFDWPFLESRWDINIQPGSRYLPFPTQDDLGLTTAINFERAGALRLYIKWNNIWQDVFYGINEIEEFNYIDSDQGQVLDPVQKWMFSDENDFEIWPINASTQLLRFTGQRTLTCLTNPKVGPPPVWVDSTTLDLDDLLVVYYSAAEYMAREEQTEIAQQLLAKGQARMQLIRATYPQRQQPPVIVGGGSTYTRRQLRLVPLVVVGRN